MHLRLLIVFIPLIKKILTSENDDQVPAEFIEETFNRTFYMRDNDVFGINFANFFNLYSTSINFTSNNDQVQLPGIINKDNEMLHAKDFPLKIKNVKAANNFLFMLNKRTEEEILYIFEFDGKQNFVNKKDNKLFKFFRINSQLKCSDIYVNNNNSIILICWDDRGTTKKRIEKKYDYYVIGYDYFADHINMKFLIRGEWLSNPKIKKINPQPNVKDFKATDKDIYLVYDKQSDPTVQLDSKNKLIIFSTQKEKDKDGKTVYELNQIRHISYNEILFNNEITYIKIVNIFVITDLDHCLVFNIREMDKDHNIQQYVYVVQLNNYTEDIETLGFGVKKDLVQKKLLAFLMSEQFYIVVDSDLTFSFCVYHINHCKSGQMGQDWTFKRMYIIGTKGVVLMTVRGVDIILTNDFETNSIYYIYDESVNIRSTYFIKLQNELFQDAYHLVNIYDHGFRTKDITISTFFKLTANAAKNNPRTKVWLDDRKTMELAIKYWDGKQIVTEDRFLNPTIMRNNKDYFMIRLPFLGSNMHFQEPQRTIRYFNKVEFNFHVIDPKDRGKFFFYGKGNEIYLFFAESVIHFDCNFSVRDMVTNCMQIAEIKFENKIEIDPIEHGIEQGNYIALIGKKASALVLYDYKLKKQIAYEAPPSFKNDAYNCSVNAVFFVCEVEVSKNFESLVFYTFGDAQTIVELKNITEEFNETLENLKKESKLGEITELRINSISTDYINVKNIAVLINAVTDQLFNTILLNIKVTGYGSKGYRIKKIVRKYEIEENPKINKNVRMISFNKKLIFINVDPKFFMFCYDRDTYFEFEYLDVQEIIDLEKLLTHNLIAFVYQSHGDKQYYYVIYRITYSAPSQLVRNEVIKDYNKNIKIGFIVISTNIIGIIQYDIETRKILNSYVFFDNGPILVADDWETPITIDGKQYKLNGQDDNNFSINHIVYKNRGDIYLNTADKGIVNLNDCIKLYGHVKTVSMLEEKKYRNRLTIKEPLMLSNLNTKIDDFEDGKNSAKNSRNNNYFEIFDDTIIYQIANDNTYKVVRIKDEKKNKLEIRFDLPDNINCYSIIYKDAYLACFYSVGPFHKVSIVDLNSEAAPAETYDMQLPGKLYKFVSISNERFILSGVGHNNKSAFLCVLNRIGKTIKWHIISNYALYTDILKVYDYHATYHEQQELITMIIFDGYYNSLRFYQVTDTFKPKQHIKKDINLHHINTNFLNITCIEEYPENFKWKFMILASSKIYIANLELVETKQPGNFNFELRPEKEFYNAFYDATFNPLFRFEDVYAKNYLFLYDINSKNSKKRGNRIIMYNHKSKEAKYSTYIYDIPPDEQLLGVYAGINDDSILYFYANESQLMMRKLDIDQYKLNVLDEPYVKDTKVEFLADFEFGGTKKFTLYFRSENKEKEDDYQNQEIEQLLLLICIIVVTLLILVCLVALVILFNDRKKELRRALEDAEFNSSIN